MIVPSLEWAFGPFLKASVISLVLQLNCEMVEILSYVLKSNQRCQLHCIWIMLQLAWPMHVQMTLPVQNFQKLTHGNDQFLASGKNKV